MKSPLLKNCGFTKETAGDGEWIAQQALGELARVDQTMVYVFDQQSRRFLYLDGPCEQLFGLTREQLLADGDAWQRVLEPADQAVATTLQRDLELHGQVMRVLHTVLPNGQQRTVRASMVARQILGRSVVAGSVVELGLRECSPEYMDMYRLAVERTHEGVAITDAAGSFLYLNREHLMMFGYDRVEELVGQSWRVFYEPEGVRRIEKEVFPELSAKGVWRGRLRARRRDGTLFHEALTLSLLPSGGIVCNCRDVSDQVELSVRLEASEEMFRTFLNSLPVAVTIRELSGGYDFVNKATQDFLGLEIDGTARAPGMEVCLTKDLSFAYWGAADQRVARTGEEVRFDFPVTWAGKEWVLDVQKLPLRIGSTGMTHVCTLVNDVTERRKLERQSEIDAQQRQAYNLMQREFISMVSHEFRTPLTAIKGVHYLLTKKIGSLPPTLLEGVRRLLDMQDTAIGTLGDLVDQVLLLNRIEHMSLEVAPQAVRLAEFVRRIVTDIGALLRTERLVLDLNAPEDFFAMLDEPQMRAVLENLISNGLKYAPETTKVRMTVKVEGDRWELTVADRGRGIPEDDQAKLFQPFHRASNVGQVRGTGLGLTIIRRVVNHHRGSVSVSSKVGQGTTFKLSFPQEFSVSSAPVPVEANAALPFSKHRPF